MLLATLKHVCDNAGPLRGVDLALFEGDPGFVTAVCLRFEALALTFRAVPESDTLTAQLAPLQRQPVEAVLGAAGSPPWADCVGSRVSRAWLLTNQHGHADGARLEFTEPSQETVELLVDASALRIFRARVQEPE